MRGNDLSPGCNQPGAGDPYWFEWYVGLDYVISMLAGDNNIESVTFQEAGLEGVDDVVVRRSQGLPTLCVQVKHKKMTSSNTDSLTFGTLTQSENNKKPLIASLAAGWKQIADEAGMDPEIVLYTNRKMGSRKSVATYEDRTYTRLPLGEFWGKISPQLESATSFTDVRFTDSDLETQWHEFVDSTMLNENAIVPFLKSLTIEAGAPSLNDKEAELTSRLRGEVCAGRQELASSVFDLLAAELRRWCTAAGNNVVTPDIARKCVCKLNHNPLGKPIAVPPPRPVFPSRVRMCSSLCEKLASSNSKVIFLQGRPGSGKTRLVSYLCERMNPRPIRFYAFKPLDVDTFSYSPDAGIVSSKELWGTLLNQLRDLPELSKERPRIPIFNEICRDDDLRAEVLRLAKILSDKRGSNTVLAIDGIDHAARATEKLTFLKRLPSPESIPEGVRLLISGQPANLYSSYPQWLKGKHAGVDVVDIPGIDHADVSMLLEEKTSFSPHGILIIAHEIINMTKGNTLSAVYAVHAISDETDCDRAIEKLKTSGISDNVEEYYESIWQKANDEVQRHHGVGSNALDLIASSMHLLDGAIHPKLLCKAFPEVFSGEHAAIRDISILAPLMRICADGSAWPIHNDFRIFVSSKAMQFGMEGYLDYSSNRLADAVLEMEDDVVKSCYSIRLLACSGREQECISLFDTSYVINAVAHGVSWRNLCEQAETVYEIACKSRRLENVFRVQLALSTLSQINEHFEYWLERRPFLHFDGLVGMDYMVPPLNKETAALYATILDRCLWLLNDAGRAEQSEELYGIWFSGLTPSRAAKMLSDPNGDGRRYRQEDDLSLLMSAWGEFAAACGIGYDEPPTDSSLTPDVDNLLTFYRDSYVRGSLNWCRPQESIAEIISGISITEDAAANIMRDILVGTLPAPRAARCAFFSRLASYSFERALGTLAYALCLSEGLASSDADRSQLLLFPRKGSIYEKDFTLELFAESFIFGYESSHNDFGSMVRDMQDAIVWMDSSHREHLSFVRALRASACLGYSAGHGEAIRPGTKEASVLREWSKAPSWPGSLTIETCAVPYMMFVAEKGASFSNGALEGKDLESFVFSNKPLCTKLRILNHLQRIGNEIPKRYLQKIYGINGSDLLVTQDAVETHEMLRPLLLTCDRELALHCDEAILFGSARFTDHKDYSLSNLIEIFSALSDLGMATESQALNLLELDNAATQSGDNRLSDTLMRTVGEWAVDEGVSQLSRIRSCQSEYKYNYSLIEFQLRSLLMHAKSLDDVLAIFAGLLGHTSCCSPEDYESLHFHIETCKEKAIELGCGSDFIDTVSDIKRAIEDAPIRKSSLPDAKESSEDDCLSFSTLTDEEVRKAAFLQEIDPWHWESTAKACSELVRRGFEKSEVSNTLVETRGAALANSGWTHYSTPLTELIDAIAIHADDASFFKFLSLRKKKLGEYGFGSAANDIAHIILVRAQSKNPALLETMFELECDSKRRWITCNKKCELPTIKHEKLSLPRPKVLAEHIADILIDSVIAHDPHRTENATRGIAWGGLHVEGIKGRTCKALPNLDSYGRILLEKVLDCWMCAYPGDEDIANCLLQLINEVSRADEACVLSIIAETPRLILRPDMKDPKPVGDGSSKIPSRIEGFLLEAQMFCDDGCEDIRNAIESCCEEEVAPFIRRYMRSGDTLLPIYQLDDYCQELLYAKMCHGRWRAIPSYITASKLIDPADAWVFSRIPTIKDPSKFGVSEAIDLFEAGDTAGAKKLVENLPMFGISKDELCLGWKLYIPYGGKEEYEYYGTARITSLDCENPDNVIDREFGCYGLLSGGVGGRYSHFSQNSASLCNALAGSITMIFCDCQVFPSLTMRRLGFEPKIDDPLIWVDKTGNQVAWFEQFSFPVENSHHSSAYYWQPRLWRWVCSEGIIEKAVKKNGCRIYWATESSKHVDQIKERYDMAHINEQKSPFDG